MPNQHTGKQYSKEDCINALKEAADILGHSPKMDEYTELEVYPGHDTIVRRFGSWNEAKEEAGLKQYFKREGVPNRLDMSEDEWWDLNSSQRYTLKAKEKIADYKLSRGCSKCGYDKHPHALDFHHTDKSEKEFDIGWQTSLRSSDEIQEEINKCEVLCSNCHRELESKYDWS